MFPLRMAAVLALSAASLSAQTFEVQPPLGLSTDAHIAFSGLNGTAVTGQHLLIDFVYPTGQALRDYGSPFGSNFNIWVTFDVQPIAPVLGGMQVAGSGGFLDRNGAIIPNVSHYNNFVASNGVNVVQFGLLLGLNFNSSLNGTTFDTFGAHYDVTLPNLLGAQITGGDFHIFAGSGGGPFRLLSAVPDNGATLALLALGVVALLILRRTSRPAPR